MCNLLCVYYCTLCQFYQSASTQIFPSPYAQSAPEHTSMSFTQWERTDVTTRQDTVRRTQSFTISDRKLSNESNFIEDRNSQTRRRKVGVSVPPPLPESLRSGNSENEENPLSRCSSDGFLSNKNHRSYDVPVRKISTGGMTNSRQFSFEPKDILRAKLKNTRSMVNLVEDRERHWLREADQRFIAETRAQLLTNLHEMRATSWNDLSTRQLMYRPWFDAKPQAVSNVNRGRCWCFFVVFSLLS